MIRKLAPIVNLVLLTAAVYLAVDFFYKIAVDKLEAALPTHADQTVTARPRGVAGGKPLAEYAVIAQRNIFKAREKAVDQSLSVDLDKLKRTDLDLRLLGTISGLGANSYAVIEQVKTRGQELYKTGDTVDQARIKLILRKKVVLTIDGRDEVLEIPEERLTAATDKRGISAFTDGGAAIDDPRAMGEAVEITLNRAELEQSFNNVNELMRSVRVRPHFSEGKPDGLRLDNVTAGSIFKDMGLQDKDVIVGVNSKRINSVDDCMEVYRNLSSASELMLEVKRDNASRFIKYTIR